MRPALPDAPLQRCRPRLDVDADFGDSSRLCPPSTNFSGIIQSTRSARGKGGGARSTSSHNRLRCDSQGMQRQQTRSRHSLLVVDRRTARPSSTPNDAPRCVHLWQRAVVLGRNQHTLQLLPLIARQSSVGTAPTAEGPSGQAGPPAGLASTSAPSSSSSSSLTLCCW